MFVGESVNRGDNNFARETLLQKGKSLERDFAKR